MSDYPSGDEHDHDDPPDIPASVIFSEIMRQAATRPRPGQPDTSAEPRADTEAASALPDTEVSAPTQPLPPPVDEQTRLSRREAALERQRLQRLQRRKTRRRRKTVGTVGGLVRTLIVVFLAAGLVSTIFTFFTDPKSFGPKVVSGIQIADATGLATIQPTSIPVTPNWLRTIGVVSGHRGPENDPGAVCPDGLTEAEINFNVAQKIVQTLRGRGYNAELLDEFDPRLENYQAAALVSVHSNTCQDYGEVVSGFLVAKAAARPEGGPDVELAECIALYYQHITGLERRFTLTADMTNYHSFREIHPTTPAAIIELGFMFNDRVLLTTRQDDLATGIVNGILCFLEPEPPPLPATPPPE